MTILRVFVGFGLFLAGFAPGFADQAPIVHYAPAQNLENIDVSLLDRARNEIDIAAYILTDWPVMQALNRAANRGVRVRIYIDSGSGFGGGYRAREPSPAFLALVDNPGIEIRVKRAGAPLMHLKSYQIDGRLLRTGAANFTASGLKQQDNDLIIIDSPGVVAAFGRRFEAIYAKGDVLPRGIWSRYDPKLRASRPDRRELPHGKRRTTSEPDESDDRT